MDPPGPRMPHDGRSITRTLSLVSCSYSRQPNPLHASAGVPRNGHLDGISNPRSTQHGTTNFKTSNERFLRNSHYQRIAVDDGYFQSQCRACNEIVYEGPWLSPPQRRSLHEYHRGVCEQGTALPQVGPTTVSALASQIRTRLSAVASEPSNSSGPAIGAPRGKLAVVPDPPRT